jgi:hypothetical protein
MTEQRFLVTAKLVYNGDQVTGYYTGSDVFGHWLKVDGEPALVDPATIQPVAVPVVIGPDKMPHCPDCGKPIWKKPHYCPHCGQRLGWEV